VMIRHHRTRIVSSVALSARLQRVIGSAFDNAITAVRREECRTYTVDLPTIVWALSWPVFPRSAPASRAIGARRRAFR